MAKRDMVGDMEPVAESLLPVHMRACVSMMARIDLKH